MKRGILYSVLTASLAAMFWLPAAASAATSIGTVSWQGNDPEGSSNVYSYSWGVSNTGSVQAGGGGGAGKVRINDFHFTKPISSGTPRYFYDLAKGTHLKLAQFQVPIGDTGASVSYCMSGVQITNVNDSATQADVSQSGGTPTADPMENVTLTFNKMSVETSISLLNVVTLEDSPKGGLKFTYGHSHTVCPNPGT